VDADFFFFFIPFSASFLCCFDTGLEWIGCAHATHSHQKNLWHVWSIEAGRVDHFVG
jgi:hypothetical protein